MANIDAPFGLRPVGELGSEIQNGGTSKYQIADNSTKAIYKGDVVTILGTGYIDVNDDATSITANVGVFNGCFYIDPTTTKPTWSNYYPGAVNITQGTIDAFVYDDPNKLFLVQCAGTLSQAAVGGNADLATYVAGSTVNGQSKQEMAASSASGAATLRIIRLCEDPDNSDISADNGNWVVRLNESVYMSTTGV